jgi:hypothetical protein
MDEHDLKLLDRQVQNLLQVQLWMRWAVVILLWSTLGAFCIWRLRSDIALWLEYFTWSAVRISLQRDRLTFLGIGLCVGMTLSTLIWQSWHILWGIRKSEYRALAKQVMQIRQTGKKHPLWRWVCQEYSQNH